MPLILSVICGFICGRVVFSIYEDKSVLDSNIIYLLKDDSYSDYDSMKASYLSDSYTYFEEDGTYNTIVALTKDLLNDKELISTIDDYDNKIKNTTDKEEIKKIVSSMNNIYKERDNIKMVKIS